MRSLIAFTAAFALATAAFVLPAAPAQAQAVPPVQDKQYILRFGDTLNLKVVENEKLAIDNQPIRPDGRVSLPLVGEVLAGGLTLPQLTERVGKLYGKFFVDPHVVINVATFRKIDINVVGLLNRPGTYQVAEPVRLLHAIALGGGFHNQRSDLRDVLVLRATGKIQHIDVYGILDGKIEDNVLIYDGDTVRVNEVSTPDYLAILPPIASVIGIIGTLVVIAWRVNVIAR